MEQDSKERKQKNCNAFLTAFVAVTFTVALLEGVGLAIFYSHFQSTNTALEARISGLEHNLITLGLDSTTAGTEGGEPIVDSGGNLLWLRVNGH